MADGSEDRVRKYPIDYDALQKGDELTAEQLRDVLGKKPGTDEFRFAVMSLQALIQEKTGLTVKCTSDNGMRVLTDAEAAEHNRKLFAQNYRAMMFRHSLNAQVDVDNLSADQRSKHDRTLMVQSRYVSAMAGVTKFLSGGGEKKKFT
jgi:hypothetical protein